MDKVEKIINERNLGYIIERLTIIKINGKIVSQKLTYA